VDNIKPQVDEIEFPDGKRIILLSEGRLVNLGNAMGHPSFVMSRQLHQPDAGADRAVDQPRQVREEGLCAAEVLDEKVAALHLDKLGVKLTKLQAAYIGVLTDTVRELERLEGEGTTARNAFQALAGLIEASPLPMWHRGPDYRLSFVNSAYVDAVNGENGDDVVGNEIELVEPVNGVTPISAAAKAQEAGQPVERLVSATISGERRQIKVYDIPMGEVGVGGIAIDMQELINARSDARRQGEAQRNMLDKMSAAVAQFAADRTLTFWNLPFQRQFGMREEWLSESPEFARVLERMRESGTMPDVRDFPNGGQSAKTGFIWRHRLRKTGCCPMVRICASSGSRPPTMACC
jgi:PAS domain-containing protein